MKYLRDIKYSAYGALFPQNFLLLVTLHEPTICEMVEYTLSMSGRVLDEATRVANDMGISHTTFQLEARAEDVDVSALQVGEKGRGLIGAVLVVLEFLLS